MRRQRSPIFFPLVLVLLGLVILLNNFLLINADVVSLWPLVLVIIGIGVIWRGDLAPSWAAHTFGITRGSVKSASLEINSAEIDVRLRALKRAGRLIAGQYTARSRPHLTVRKNHASLVMRRGQTWLFSLADWELALAGDVPWSLLMSSHLGELQADLRGIRIEKAHIASGIGDIRVMMPNQKDGVIYINSTFGDIQLGITRVMPVLIHVKPNPLTQVIANEADFVSDETRQYYASPAFDPDAEALEVIVGTTFGNITLSLVNQD